MTDALAQEGPMQHRTPISDAEFALLAFVVALMSALLISLIVAGVLMWS